VNFIYIATDDRLGFRPTDAVDRAGAHRNSMGSRQRECCKSAARDLESAPPANSKDAPDPSVTVFIMKEVHQVQNRTESNRSLSILYTSEGGVYQYKICGDLELR